MQYWDTSALVPLVLEERASAALHAEARRDTIVTWCLTSVEIVSAVERRAREGHLDAGARADAVSLLNVLVDAWIEVAAVAAVRDRARRLLGTHSLRSGDALQLAAALVATNDQPQRNRFVCLDTRLRDAAAREGFDVRSF